MAKRNNYNEIGMIRKNWHRRLKIALVYPNTYPVGMSNLGFQTVYRLFNEVDNVVCERAFLPDKNDLKNDIRTVESAGRLADFDIIAFSISFENDYLNLPAIFEKAGLPLYVSNRSSSQPLVMAGGVACFLNPEPIAAFIDCFLIGEAEAIIPDFLAAYDLTLSKQRRLETLLREVGGVYIPTNFEPAYHSDGTLATLTPTGSQPPTIKRITASTIADTPAYNTILTADTTFKNTLLIEVTRGCPHGCRFCSAGYVYRPPRFMDPLKLKALIQKGSEQTRHIGLVGAAVTDLPQIDSLCNEIGERKINLSFSSLRADSLSPELIQVIRNSHLKTATIAPDAGSERMRRVINKGMQEDQILEATTTLVASGIPNLKLYFMVGLPTETHADVEAIVHLCALIKDRFLEASRPQKRIGTITVSVNAFIPKPFTPFQWAPMEAPNSLNKKIKYLKKHLNKIPNMRLQAESPRKAYVQALLSRGDRQLASFIEQVHNNGGNWPQTLNQSHLDTDFYVIRERPAEERLPWDFIDHGLKKSFLLREWQRAQSAQPSPPCPMRACTLCGVC